MNSYRSVNICHFSGTGNALTASRWIAEQAARQDMSARLQAIDRFDKRNIPQPEEGQPFFCLHLANPLLEAV